MKEPLQFIQEFHNHEGPDKVEAICHLFRAGFCYYFAHMLQLAFHRGTVCYAWDIGHFIWVDTDGVAYDVEGINQDYDMLVPEERLGHAVCDFLHNGEIHGATRDEIDALILPTDFVEQYRNTFHEEPSLSAAAEVVVEMVLDYKDLDANLPAILANTYTKMHS